MSDINIVGLVKGEEHYVFMFDDEHRTETLRQFGRFASNPELSFTWYDSAVMTGRVWEQVAVAGRFRQQLTFGE